jgi:hypothetical protein
MIKNQYLGFYNCFGKFRRFPIKGLFSKIQILGSILLFVSICLIACDKPSGPSPEKLYKEYIQKLYRQDYGFFSKESIRESIDSLKRYINMEKELKGENIKKSNLKKLLDPASGEVNIDSLANFICKALEEKGIKQNKMSILNPVSKNFDIEFFIKNSTNMNGYIAGKSGFKETVFGLITELKLSRMLGNTNKLRLHYINTKIAYTQEFNRNDTYDATKILNEFTGKIGLQKFIEYGKKNGGDVSETDFHKIFAEVLKKVNKNSVAVLVADFVYSPGKGRDSDEYESGHKNGIRLLFNNKKREQDLALYILKMESDFEGRYYTRKPGVSGAINDKRPYYIWFIGLPLHIAQIVQDGSIQRFLREKHSTDDKMILEYYADNAIKQPEFEIYRRKKGNDVLCWPNNKERTIGVATLKDFNCSIDVNFVDAFRDSSFFTKPSNYKVVSKGDSSKYTLNIGESKSKGKGFKYNLALSADKADYGEIKITLEDKIIPNWVKESSSEDDSNITKDSLERTKTYKFENLIKGVHLAFYPDLSSEGIRPLQALTVNIKKKEK